MSLQVTHNGISTGRAYEYGGIFPLFAILGAAAKAFLPTIAATVIPSIGQAVAARVTQAIAPAAPAPSFGEFEEEEEFFDDDIDALLGELEELEMGEGGPSLPFDPRFITAPGVGTRIAAAAAPFVPTFATSIRSRRELL